MLIHQHIVFGVTKGYISINYNVFDKEGITTN